MAITAKELYLSANTISFQMIIKGCKDEALMGRFFYKTDFISEENCDKLVNAGFHITTYTGETTYYIVRWDHKGENK